MYRQPSHRDMNKAHALLFALMMMTVSLAGYFLGGDEDSTNEDIELKDEIQLLSAVLEQNWDIVDHNSGRLCSLALDATGNVHVSYYSQDQMLKYAVYDGVSWEISTVESQVTEASSSIAIGSDGDIHISYVDNSRILKYARHDGNNWDISSIDGGGESSPYHIEMVLDSNEKIHIVHQGYYPNSSDSLRYTTYNGTSWETYNEGINNFSGIQLLENYSGYAGGSPSIAVDLDDNIHISHEYEVMDQFYPHNTSTSLIHSTYSESIWNHEIIDGETNAEGNWHGYESSIDIDSLGNVHVMYSGYGETAEDKTNGSILKYAHLNSESWIVSTVDNSSDNSPWEISDLGLNSALVIDFNDNLHATYSGGDDDPMYATLINGTWELTSLELPYTEANLGVRLNGDSSFAISSDGTAHAIAFDDNHVSDEYLLRYTSWPLDLDGDGFAGHEDSCANTPGNSTNDRSGCIDTDGDGYSDPNTNWTIIDGGDAFISDSTQWSDRDGDGYGDNINGLNSDNCPDIWGNSSLRGCMDADNDGVDDSRDAFPNNSSEQFDADGDGLGDNVDAFPNDISEWMDTDGDGVGDNIDVCPDEAGSPAGNTPGCEGVKDDSSIPGFGLILTISSMLGAVIIILRRN